LSARVDRKRETQSPFSADEVARALSRILTSKYFINAPKKQKFLRLVCDFYLNGRAADLNEYLIGREVFDRDDSYNPSVDPIVRVGAHDVRKKLELYYQTEGVQDDIRLDIPVGGYGPLFSRFVPSVAAPELDEAPAETYLAAAHPLPVEPPSIEVPPEPQFVRAEPVKSGKLLMLLVGALSLMSLALFAWAVYLRQQTEGARAVTALGEAWAPFFSLDEPPLLVLSNPPVYRFSNVIDPPLVIDRSLELSDQQAATVIAALKDRFVMKQNRIPRLVLSFDSYTGIGEAIGIGRLTDLFRSAGRAVSIKQSRTVSAEDLRDHNVIMLGSTWANEWSGKLAVTEDFVHTGSATIENRAPRPSEEREYKPSFDASNGQLSVDYGLITIKPNISESNEVMVLAGIHSQGTQAAVEYITGRSYLSDLEHRLRQIGEGGKAPRYFQVLLRVGVENGIPTTITPISIHRLTVAAN
jgi:hypothetical protein